VQLKKSLNFIDIFSLASGVSSGIFILPGIAHSNIFGIEKEKIKENFSTKSKI